MEKESEKRMVRDIEQKDWMEINVIEVFSALIRSKWLILFCGVFLALSFYLYSSLMITEQFQSSTQIYVVSRQNNEATVTYTDLQSGNYLIQDYKELIVSEPVLQQVIAELGLNINQETLKKKINIITPSDTRVLQIIVTDENPYKARNIANELREAASKHITSVMDIEAVNVVKYANIPNGPCSPNTIKYALIGGILGVVLAMLVVIMMDIFDDSIKTQEDVEKYLGLSFIGAAPMLKEPQFERSRGEKRRTRRSRRKRKRERNRIIRKRGIQ